MGISCAETRYEKNAFETFQRTVDTEYIRNDDKVTEPFFQDLNDYIINYNWDKDINDIAGDYDTVWTKIVRNKVFKN